MVKVNALIDNFITDPGDWRGDTIANIRRIIRETDPNIVEEVKWRGAAVWSHDGIICVANAFKDKVKLIFYRGADLPDPNNLFNNGLEGKQWRTIDFHRGDTVNEAALKALIRAAVAENRAKVKTAGKAPATRGSEPKKPAK
ncbi:MAG: DUF1801 domain-containing protein [Dehalococcoidales bacterium]